MKKNKYSQSIDVFEKNNGILRMSEAMRLGVPKHMLYSLFNEGLVIREYRGLYRLDSDIGFSNPDLVKIGLLVPKAIICLVSALYYYRLTTQIPNSVYIAIPRNLRTPKITYPPVEVIRLSSKAYFAGIDNLTLDGVSIKIYSPEKTIADCFKFRSKIGTDIAIEALKDYMNKYHPKIDKLMEYARINRVEKLMHPYLETLV